MDDGQDILPSFVSTKGHELDMSTKGHVLYHPMCNSCLEVLSICWSNVIQVINWCDILGSYLFSGFRTCFKKLFFPCLVPFMSLVEYSNNGILESTMHFGQPGISCDYPTL